MRWRLLFFVMFVGTWNLPSMAEAGHRALIVGVGKYQISSANLSGIDKDVKMMRALAEKMGFKSHEIKTLMDSEATLQGIESAIETWLIKGVTEDDYVLFYFSGHGSFVHDYSGDEEDNIDEVLLPHDVKKTGGALENVLLDDRFGSLLSRIPSKNIIVFIDSCHSGTVTKSLNFTPKFFPYEGMPMAKGNFGVQETDKVENYLSLTACQDDEQALATTNGSLFTQGLLRSAEELEKSGGTLSVSVLKEMSTRFIVENVKDAGQAHHPQIYGDVTRATRSLTLQQPDNELFHRLEGAAERAAYKVKILADKSVYREGESLQITADLSEAGFLNVLSLGANENEAVVLFPNQYHSDNSVAAGQTIRIPAADDRFRLPAGLSPGETEDRVLVVAFHTKERINLYEEGVEQGFFLRNFNLDSTRGNFGVIETSTVTYGAGKILVRIVQ